VLPYNSYTFFVPQGEHATDIIFILNQTEEISLSDKIMPGQISVPIGSELHLSVDKNVHMRSFVIYK
jgi:hypothetical protein